MLTLVIVLFGLALLAGLLGFTRLSVGLMAMARIAFYILIVLFVISLVLHLLGVGATSAGGV